MAAIEILIFTDTAHSETWSLTRLGHRVWLALDETGTCVPDDFADVDIKTFCESVALETIREAICTEEWLVDAFQDLSRVDPDLLAGRLLLVA